MAHRIVDGLVYAARLQAKPKQIPISRPRGRKAQGVRYERALAKALPLAEHGVWWEYRDLAGPGFCQTDLVLDFGTDLVVLEAKYTWVAEGRSQIDLLYAPVLGLATGKRVWGIVVCKVLVPGVRDVCRDLNMAIAAAVAGRSPTLQWLPGTPLADVLSPHKPGVAGRASVR